MTGRWGSALSWTPLLCSAGPRAPVRPAPVDGPPPRSSARGRRGRGLGPSSGSGRDGGGGPGRVTVSCFAPGVHRGRFGHVGSDTTGAVREPSRRTASERCPASGEAEGHWPKHLSGRFTSPGPFRGSGAGSGRQRPRASPAEPGTVVGLGHPRGRSRERPLPRSLPRSAVSETSRRLSVYVSFSVLAWLVAEPRGREPERERPIATWTASGAPTRGSRTRRRSASRAVFIGSLLLFVDRLGGSDVDISRPVCVTLRTRPPRPRLGSLPLCLPAPVYPCLGGTRRASPCRPGGLERQSERPLY